jgi:hypothetical protein
MFLLGEEKKSSGISHKFHLCKISYKFCYQRSAARIRKHAMRPKEFLKNHHLKLTLMFNMNCIPMKPMVLSLHCRLSYSLFFLEQYMSAMSADHLMNPSISAPVPLVVMPNGVQYPIIHCLNPNKLDRFIDMLCPHSTISCSHQPL